MEKQKTKKNCCGFAECNGKAGKIAATISQTRSSLTVAFMFLS